MKMKNFPAPAYARQSAPFCAFCNARRWTKTCRLLFLGMRLAGFCKMLGDKRTNVYTFLDCSVALLLLGWLLKAGLLPIPLIGELPVDNIALNEEPAYQAHEGTI